MHIVKSVGVMSFAKIMALVQGCLGLLFAPLFLLIGVAGSLAGQHRTPLAGVLGVVLAVLMPVFYGVTGFVAGAMAALLYNFFARLVGGFELELELQPQTLTAPYPIIPPTSLASKA
jgi:hypothetical protein